MKPLDLNQAAINQYGPGSKAVLLNYHLWSWRVEKGGTLFNIDLNRAAIDQYGPGYFAASKGVHAYDWGAVNLDAAGYKVLPVLIVPRDYFFRIDEVKDAVARYSNNLNAAKSWYRDRVGATFDIMQTLVCYSPKSADDWDYFSHLNKQPGQENKERLLNESISAFEAVFPYRGQNIRIALCAYTGLDTDDWTGAMNRGKYGAITPRVSAVEINYSNIVKGSIEADALHTLIHELGHGFGLPHPNHRNPIPDNYGQSFMMWTWPPDSIALNIEKTELKNTPWIK